MASYNKRISDTLVRLGEVRFSYAHVFVPQENDQGEEKYSVCVLIPKKDTDTVKLVEEAVEAAKQKGKASNWGGKIPAKCKSPLRDGDEDRPDDPNYAGMYFINCNSRNKPGVRVLENGQVVEALGTEDFYSGCWGAVTLNFFPYGGAADKKSKGNMGVGAGLNNLIKTRDDERLAGGTDADADFSDLGGDSELD